ncbi:cytochrome c oxidase assembly factor Coa1 family protein [Flavobacterium sp. HJSW_4]|uniref:cytochrome c oxidase assembly factor Coa1 family protein n=1 Tax=Flavobacterium sp. HJSW_4 TaxID=3344660 RepID=UPI0035F33AEF
MEDSNELIQRKSWWNRNWKWFVPSGCLTLLVLFGLFIGGIFYEATSVIKDSDAYKESMAKLQNNKTVMEKLGSPIETDGIVSGVITSYNSVRACDVEVPIKGPKGKGTLFVVGEKRGTWKYTEMSVYIENTKEKIDLLQK